MVTRYGMSQRIGTINYESQQENVFLGYDLGHEARYSEYIQGEIDREVKAIIDECYEKAKAVILANEDVLYRAAELLMEKEKLTGEEFDALFKETRQEKTV
jgi:cell division protease FtsH